MKLVEVIRAETSPDVIETLSEFCDRRLGKGVVVAKTRPTSSPIALEHIRC
jgi:3-hydroxyacyl-CoA dehydrogenase